MECAPDVPNNPPTKPDHPEPSRNKTAKPAVLKRSTESPDRRTQPDWVQTHSTGSTPAASTIYFVVISMTYRTTWSSRSGFALKV